jgi:hypothetical protein
MNYRPTGYAPILFAALTAVTQVVGIGIGFIVWSWIDTPFLCVLAACLTSTFVAYFLGLAAPWIALNGILPLAAAVTTAVEIPQYVFLAPLVILGLVYAPAFWTRVPYYPTSRETYPLVLAELPTDRPFTFVDIGCGFGDLIFFLAQHRPQGHFIGIEIGFIPMAYARVKALILRRAVTIQFQSMWSVSYADYDFVYAFLSPAPMPRLWDKLSGEMNEGSTFFSNTFPVPATPDQIVHTKDRRRSTLFVFKMKPPHPVATRAAQPRIRLTS